MQIINGFPLLMEGDKPAGPSAVHREQISLMDTPCTDAAEWGHLGSDSLVNLRRSLLGTSRYLELQGRTRNFFIRRCAVLMSGMQGTLLYSRVETVLAGEIAHGERLWLGSCCAEF